MLSIKFFHLKKKKRAAVKSNAFWDPKVYSPVPYRKPRKEEHLSEEAAKVMASLPDLSFMQAKVLMFPTTLTPLSSQATAD